MPTISKEPLKVVRLAGPFFILPTYKGRLFANQEFAA